MKVSKSINITCNRVSDPIVRLFLSDWLDTECAGKYEIHTNSIQFEVPEDATYIKLKSLPEHLLAHIILH